MPGVLSKSQKANPLYNIDETWARSLKGLRVKAQGKAFINFDKRRNREWFGGVLFGYDNDRKMWKCRFDSDTDKTEHLRYDFIIKWVDEEAPNFHQYHLPVSPVPPPSTTATVNSTKYKMTDVIDWKQVFEDTEHPPIPILPIPFEGDQEEFDVDITPAELEELKDDQGVIRFEKVMEWCLSLIHI